ncbi:MAG: M14 family zinc carboxypeptidase [Vicinamibacterales bacterium]
MTLRVRMLAPLALALVVLLPGVPAAQRRAAAPVVSDDPEFAAFVKAATTKAEFSSPLVDHLPRRPGVPTPKDVLGYHVGTEKKLTYWADQQRWYRALEQALPGRVKTEVIGTTEEGRQIMVVFLTGEANMRTLERNRENMRRLADPRGLSEAEAQRLIATTKPHYHLSAGLHSGETNTSEMLMELAYRLAVSDEPYIRQIRDNVIVSLTPTTDIDGRDRYVDWYNAYKIDEAYDGGETYGEPPYWGKYVFHDNNRDINYGVDTLRTHLQWYLRWLPPVWHDLHEAQTLLYTYSGGAPQNPNWDPTLYSDLMFFANYEVSRLTGYGMPGVWHFGFMDAWSPGYLAIAAQNHNGMLRMYEIFNQQGANTKKARFSGPATTRQWFRPNPVKAGEVDWSIRNSINYSESAVLSALDLTSQVPAMVVGNYYRRAVNAVKRGDAGPPYAFVIPAGQGDQTRVDRVANLLRLQAIEVRRTREEITVQEGTFPAGSYVVKLNQPYGPLARTLLERQAYPDPTLTTYDDSAWTMGLASNVDVKTIADRAILDEPADLVDADVTTVGSVRGSAAAGTLIVHQNGALNLITLRYRLRDVPMKAARIAFVVDGVQMPAGSFLFPDSSRARDEIARLGLQATAVDRAPDVASVDVDLPRIAVFTTWSNTEKVGWVRLAFDRFGIPFDLIHKDHVRQGNLRGKYDVIVMPHQGNGGKSIVYEQPKLSKPLPYRRSERFKSFGYYTETDDVRGGMGLEGVVELQRFVEGGGTLITLGIASAFPAEFGLARGVDVQPAQPGFYAPGPYVQADVLAPEHPVMFGYVDKRLPVRYAGGPLLQAGLPPDTPAAVAASMPYRPTVIARFVGGEASVLSGLMRGAEQVRNRPMIVDAPLGAGHVLLFANNPIYRWQTFGEHGMVFNALLFWNDFPSGPAASAPGAARN